MKLLVTGANGFLGSYVVSEALRRGHSVRAIVRPTTDASKLDWHEAPGVELARADLRSRNGLTDIVRGVDAVIHLAAAKTGDLYTQYAGTVVATENLLAAMTEAGVRKIVAVSSFSVYDYLRASPLAALDEESPVEKDAFDRDAYAHTKLVQERLIREHAAKQSWDVVVIRPGVIWGRDNLLHAWVGIPAGKRLWIRTGSRATVPATYVENCAEAIVMAAEAQAARGETFNVVDDDLPTQRQYLRAVLDRMQPRPIVIPVSYSLMRLFAATVWQYNQRILKGRAKIPGLFIPCRFQARARPLVYTNRKIKKVLGWKPRYSLQAGLDRSVAAASSGEAIKVPIT